MKNASRSTGAALILLLTVLAYIPAMRGGFVWDDDDHLTANPAMTAPHGLRMIWTSLAVSRYYPLTLTSFWMQHRLWGLNPLPYHVVNIALQAVNGVLVFLVLRRLRVPGAWLAAALWAVHPVNVESVAWITELKNTQSGMFFFLALWCYLRFEAEGRRRWYVLALLCGTGAVLSKPSTVVLPLVLLLCTWWQRGRPRRNDLARLAPFFVLSLLMSVWTIAEQRGHIVHEGTDEWSLGAMERVIIAGRAIWFYAGKVLWPVRLTFVYPRWDVNVRSFSSWLPFLGLAAVGLFLYLCRRKPWARAGVFALGFYLAALLPVLGFLDIYYFRYSFVADHFQYLASLGVIAGVTGGIAAMVARHTHRLQATGRAASVVLLGMVTCLSWKQERIYWSDEALWRDTLMKNPGAWMAQNNLGNDLWATGRSQEAIDCYEQALRINARDLEAYDNLGIAMGQAGKYDDAVKNFQRALQIRPDLAQVQYNLGMALVGLGRMPEAIEHWKEAVRLEPDYIEAYYNLGVAQERAGKREEAIAQYQQALRIDPNYSPAQNALAKLQAAP